MRVRPVNPSDCRKILAIYTPIVQDTVISFEEEPPKMAEMAHRICTISERYPWFVAESETSAIYGYCYASEHLERPAYRWSVNVSIYVDATQKRAGIGKLLYGTLLNDLRRRGFYNAYAGITMPNEASVGFHQAMGFKKIGTYKGVGYKFGAWHDTSWWGLSLQEKSDHPADPQYH